MTRFPHERGLLSAPALRLLAGAGFVAIAAATGTTRAEAPHVYAITHAHVITAPGSAIDDATIVVRDGLIEAVGAGMNPPADAAILDETGKTVTAGFIDACSTLGLKQPQPSGPRPTAGFGPGRPAAQATPRGPVHPIARVHPEKKAVESLTTDETAFEKHRKIGFTSALALPSSGIFRGQAVVFDLGSRTPAENIVAAEAGEVVAFEHGRFGEGYPTSLMGAIAVVRQTLLDTQRYATWEHRYHADPIGMRRPEEISAFAALEGAMAGADRLIFDIEDSADVARALRIAEEFSINAIVIGSGAENQEPGSIDALKKAGYPVILPLAYPEKPKVEDPDEALNVSLHDLRRWHAAPANPEALHEAGIPFALGTCRLDGVGEFIGNLRKAIDRGLPVDVALASLTVQPARMFGLDRVLGTIAPGKIANLAVFEGDTPQHGVFAEKARTTRVFVDGVKFEIERKKSKRNPDAKEDPAGTWSITFSIAGRTISRTWTISGEPGHYEGTAETREGTVDFESIVVLGNEMTVKLPGRMGSRSQAIVVILKGDSLEGEGEFPGGMSFTIKGKRIAGPQGGDQ